MDVLSKARSTHAWRVCVRVAVAFCLVVFGVGDAVERSFAGHVTIESALSYAVSADAFEGISTDHSGIHVDGQSGDVDLNGQVVGHGCHGCATIPEPMRYLAAAPNALASSPSWSSVPSAAGREPLVDLPPPRA
ncbi:hypothetical protein [Hansschlegelia zhihuaiae]|uniref:DUF2946 domain-containing protein n=1 Tax=Hansschlegelia zhihuaiae TaxID=405005 RepID=A0A4Q0MHZ6_9HYPH|nr:hypothetical protein [Hansschlegelia zhihuaiae]RXF72933.1 hypothetical protein EK403_12350 [Hansschlegelia zhihuaiae]